MNKSKGRNPFRKDTPAKNKKKNARSLVKKIKTPDVLPG